jgi:peptidoglycan hydrolase-like protein with peptidoglycan-binding domain
MDFATALQDWQKSKGLPANGVLGPATWKKMKPALNAPERPEPPPAADATAAAPPEPIGAADTPPEPAAASTDAAPPEPADGPPQDGPPTDTPAQGELGYGFRARRRCGCPSCRAARASGRTCSCDACRRQQEQESSWFPGPNWLGWTPPATAPNYPVNRKSKEYIRWYQSALNRVIGAGLAVDGARGPRTRAAVRQFQSQNGLTPDGVVGGQTEAALIRAGAGMPPAASVTPSPTPAPTPTGSNAAVDTPLPRSAPGMYSHGITSRQYGVRQTIQALLSIGRRWAAAHPNGPEIGVGDISFQGGGVMKPHVSHQKGIDADIWLMRNDGVKALTTYKSPSYSQTLTQQLVDMIRTNDVLKVQFILNNDPQIQGVKPWPGHDNHLHVRFVQPALSGEYETELGEEFQSRGTRCTCPSCRTALSEEELDVPSAPTVDYRVNRKSPEYIQWYQAALNRILPASLVVDGRRGPKTRAAVHAFQRRSALKVDGVVGPITEGALLKAGAPLPPRAGGLPGPLPIPPIPVPPGPLPVPPPPNVPCGPSPTLSAAERDVLSVTSTLEGGRPFHCAVSATDGISMGSMQWNLKAGTLQSMMNQYERGTGRLASYFGTDTDRLKRLIDVRQTSLADAVAQATAERLAARWRDPLSRLCTDPFMCGLQQRDIAGRLCTAWNNFTSLGLGTVRGLSMCYDIINGDGEGAMAQVRTRALALPSWASSPEATKLQNLANFAADRLGRLREERRARRLNLANIRTAYRGTPATSGRSYADQINRTVPNLDRALTVAERTVCGLRPPSPVPSPGMLRQSELGGMQYGSSVDRELPINIPDLVGRVGRAVRTRASRSNKLNAMILAFKIPEAPYSDEAFKTVHKVFDVIEGVHAVVEIFEVELAGLLGGALAVVLAPLAGAVLPLLAIGAGYSEAKAKIAKDRVRMGFALGVVTGAHWREWSFVKSMFWKWSPEVNPSFPEAGRISQQAFNLGLVTGFIQGRHLTSGQRKFFWQSIGKTFTPGDRQQFAGDSKSWPRNLWVSWYIRASAAFIKLYVK